MTPLHQRRRARGPRWLLLVIAVAWIAVATVLAVWGWRAGGSTRELFEPWEIAAWCAIGLLSGGLVLGHRGKRPPLVASALVSSAVLLGATPLAAALVALAGALGGARRDRTYLWWRVVAAVAIGASMPGLLGMAHLAGGPVIGRAGDLNLGTMIGLWAILAVGLPLAESLGTHLLLPPHERVDAWHMLQRRFEQHTVLTALSLLAAVTYPAIGPLAALVLLLPTYAARIGFRQHEEGRRAVTQTLAAMTQLPEWVGVVGTRHTERVVLAVEAAAGELGLESRLRRDLVRAASLHELGHLDGGIVRGDRGRVARSGAAVIEQADIRPRVAAIVAATDPAVDLAGLPPDVGVGADLVRGACSADRAFTMSDPRAAGRALARARAQLAKNRTRVRT